MKNKTVKIVIVVIATVILLFAVFAVGVFVGISGVVAEKLFGEHFNGEKFITAETSEIQITEDVENIDVEWVSGNITVTRSEDENLYIIEEGRISKSDALVYKVDGDTLNIDFVKPKFGIFGINSSSSKDLTIKLPEKYYDRININSVSADVNIKNVNADKIDLESVSSEMEMRQTTFNELDIENVSGNANIYLPADASFRAEIDSVSGNINTDFSVIMQNDTYICGNGDMSISADMVSGNVGIYKQ